MREDKKENKTEQNLNVPMTTYSEYCFEIPEIISWI